jgi:DNA invertase Pin-like site-specific DNA recombinase
MSTPVAILARVSTDKQVTDRQIAELQAHAASHGWTVVEVVQEVVSGASVVRSGIARIKELAATGAIEKVLVHEVSRIARKNSTSHEFLEFLTTNGVSLYWHTQRIETLLPDGRTNPAAAIMFALLSEMARGERELLIERTKSGLQAARRRGVRLGRTPGSTERPEVFLDRYPEVARRLRKGGMSIRDIAGVCNTSTNTVLKVKKLLAPVTP